MIHLTDKQKELLRSNNVKKNWTFEIYAGDAFVGYIPTSNMVDDSFTIKEALSTSETIEIGACEAATLTVQVADIPYNLKGRNLKVWLNVEDDEESLTLPMGRFYVDECKNKNGTYFYDITAYDGMSLFDVDVSSWYRGLSFPTTVKTMRDSLCAYIGVKQESVTLPCDSVVISESIFGFALTGRNVLKAICQINGCFGHFTRSGALTYVYLNNTSTLTLKEGGGDCYQTSATHEESTAGEFDSVSIAPYDSMQTDDDNTVTYPEESDCRNTLCVQNNFLTYGLSDEMLTQIAATVYEKIKNHPYVVHNTPTQGRVWQEVGDSITLEVESYGKLVRFDTFILERTLSGFQAAADTYAAKGTETSTTLSALTAREMAIATSILSKTEVRANERELALREFNSIISSAIGLYEITETDENGAVKYYYANAATIKEATLVYTFNAGGFAWGTKDKGVDDLPEVWSYGVTNDGNAILNYLSVNKLTADHISVSNIVGAINDSSGESELYITADHVKIGSSSLTETLELYVTSENLTTKLSSYTTNEQLTSKLELYVTSKSLTATLTDYVTETGESESFSYTFTASGATFTANEKTVLQINKDGLIIYGTVYASRGEIGGFTITESQLYSTNVGISSNSEAGYAFWAGNNTSPNFYVTHDGVLNAKGAKISGDIIATSLTLDSGFRLDITDIEGLQSELDDKLDDADLTGYIYVDGTVGSTPSSEATGFVVSSEGLLQASNAIIYGTVYASRGEIAGLTIAKESTIDESGNIESTVKRFSNTTDTFHILVEEDSDGNATKTEVLITNLLCDQIKANNSSNMIDLCYQGSSSEITATLSYASSHYLTITNNGVPVMIEYLATFRIKLSDTLLADKNVSISWGISGVNAIVNQSYTTNITIPKGTSGTYEFTKYYFCQYGLGTGINYAYFAENGSQTLTFTTAEETNTMIGIQGGVIPLAADTYILGHEDKRWDAGHFKTLCAESLKVNGSEVEAPYLYKTSTLTVGVSSGNTASDFSSTDTSASANYIKCGSLKVMCVEYTGSVSNDRWYFFNTSGFTTIYSVQVTARGTKDSSLSWDSHAGSLCAYWNSSKQIFIGCDTNSCDDGFYAMIVGL